MIISNKMKLNRARIVTLKSKNDIYGLRASSQLTDKVTV